MMLAGMALAGNTGLDIGGNTEYIENDIKFGSGKKQLNPKMKLYIEELKKFRKEHPTMAYRECQKKVAEKMKKLK